MFSTKHTQKSKPVSTNKGETQKAFETVEQFSLWLDSELDVLVAKFAEFETDDSVRKFFKRS